MARERSNRGIDDPGVQLAFDYAKESSKLVLTLATAVLVLSITFLDRVVGVATLTSAERTILGLSWLLNFVSIVAGVVLLVLLAGAVSPTTTITVTKDGKRVERVVDREDHPPSIRQPPTAVAGVVQMAAFVAATGALAVVGWLTL